MVSSGFARKLAAGLDELRVREERRPRLRERPEPAGLRNYVVQHVHFDQEDGYN